MREFIALYTDGWIKGEVRRRFGFNSDVSVEDVCQEVCLRVLRRIQAEKIEDVNSMQAYVSRIVANFRIDELRRSPRDRRVMRSGQLDIQQLRSSLLVEARTHDDDAFQRQLNQAGLEALQNAVAALPPKCREVWQLRTEQEFGPSEIAMIMNISLSTVANHLNKANKAITKAKMHAAAALLEGRNYEP